MSISMSDTRIAAIDVETANIRPESICALGISVMEYGAVEEAYYSLVRPDPWIGPWDRRNIAVHGIHPEDTLRAPEFPAVYRDILPLLENSIVCAHNARFDMKCLRATCLLHGRRVPYIRWFDTLELSRRVFPDMAHHRLNDMCEALHIGLDHHNAASDAQGCLMIVAHVMERSGIYDIGELLKECGVRIYDL